MATIKNPLYFYDGIVSSEHLQIEERRREEVSLYNKENNMSWYQTQDRWMTRHLFQNSKKNAKAKNIPHTITLSNVYNMWEAQNGRCAISNVLMTWGEKSITNASIDQIIPSEGYNLGNVWLVCLGMNTLKMEYSLFELVKLYPDSLNNPLFSKVYNDLLRSQEPSHNEIIMPMNLEQNF
jgi:hypothetical protein